MGRLPANQKHQRHRKRWQRYEKPQPGHRLQMDVKFLERIAGTRNLSRREMLAERLDDAFVINDGFVIKTEAMKAAMAAAEREYEGCTRAGIAEPQGVLNAGNS